MVRRQWQKVHCLQHMVQLRKQMVHRLNCAVRRLQQKGQRRWPKVRRKNDRRQAPFHGRGESQRDSGPKPKVGARAPTLGTGSEKESTPTGLRHRRAREDATPWGLGRISWATITQGSLADSATAGLEDGIPLGFKKAVFASGLWGSVSSNRRRP